ncbi:hypothetical protein B7494_g2254 [Chlorociboria aeruginascens]|nr:hypothetical protein B7494_g2254 [Chlorociboria aeruginascens]
MASNTATNPDTLVTLKVNIDGSNRRFKLPLRDLGASTLPEKLRFLLAIPPSAEAVFERYSDSAASFIVLDSNNASVYKQLYRAAKAKLKLRLKVTIKDKAPVTPKPATVEDEEPGQSSPAVEEPVVQTYTESTPPVIPMPAPVAPEQSFSHSVAEMQRGFEELLINHPRINPSVQGSQISSCCTRNRDIPSLFAHQESKIGSGPEISVTHGATARDQWFAELAGASQERAQHSGVVSHPAPSACVFNVYCNNCQEPIPDEHYHCCTCDDGDFDLCHACVAEGVVCDGDNHWMIKRFVKNGKVINSTTETIAPKKKSPFSESKTTLVSSEEPKEVDTRTCNSCIEEMSEDNFVTCTTCEDYDLCMSCHVNNEHGHHPKHAFVPVIEDANLDPIAKALLAPGRNTAHNAICDGCDKYIYGVRHKCLECPDWDFCSTCIANASFIHPRHRFVPMYEPLSDPAALSRSLNSKSRHHGIYCDGPLCDAANGVQSYIKGDRYKCAVCNDTDFCASCEASPSNPHNRTHPLIKFKTPVRNVSVTTLGDHENGSPLPVMGDRRNRTTSKSTETTPTQSTNAATQVQTVADLQPTEVKPEPEVEPEVKEEEPIMHELKAHFVRDAVPDGSVLPPNSVFEQTWYLRNGGKGYWPSGCSVKFVGGDNMCAVDPDHPASVHELVSAAESTTCYSEVAPGQEAGFTVLMRTPNRAGNFISYWRLTGPDGEKFGHRLWCDINVKEAIKEEIKEESKEELTEEDIKAADVEAEPETSQMIFPKLDKESSITSIHEPAPAEEFDDFVDEPLADDETEDSFLTDEEYDILDASDEEYLAEQEKSVKK